MLNDKLAAEAKRLAEERNVSLSEVVNEALRERLARPQSSEGAGSFSMPVFRGKIPAIDSNITRAGKLYLSCPCSSTVVVMPSGLIRQLTCTRPTGVLISPSGYVFSPCAQPKIEHGVPVAENAIRKPVVLAYFLQCPCEIVALHRLGSI